MESPRGVEHDPDGDRETGRESSTDENKTGWGFPISFKTFREVGPLFGLGIQLAAAVIVMSLLGYWLDQQWATAPWLMIVCTCLGFAAGMYHFIKTVSDVSKRESKERESNQS